MKIQNIKINSYGNLIDKEINLEDINIIYGKNESGKSTLLNFIKNIFFGISKNKNGRDISDYDKYYPWSGTSFSGKIKYMLDNNETFEIYRDFNRKNAQIYNEYMEDVSEQFKIDKKTGNQFFIEQTGVDENTFLSTAMTEQRQVKLDKTTQGALLQKIANLTESGAEDVSYKKVLSELNSKMLEEVGTNNSKDRPINITKNNIDKYTLEIEKISTIKENRFNIEKEIIDLKQSILEKEKEKKILDNVNEILQKNKIEKEKITIKKSIIEENNEKIRELDNSKDKILYEMQKGKTPIESKTVAKKSNKSLSVIFLLASIFINIISFMFVKYKIVNIIILLFIPISIINLLLKVNKTARIEKEKLEKANIESSNIENKLEILDAKIELLEKTNERIEKEILELKSKIEENLNQKKQKLIIEYPEVEVSKLFNLDIELLIKYNKNKLEEQKLELHKLELTKDNINPELERLLNLEELLELEKENLVSLEERAKEIELAKEIIDEAYTEMKQSVTPKFSRNLSTNISDISNGKYKNLAINDGLIIEIEDGRYVEPEELSIGTIEQIYLSLRLSVMNELSKESLPIMLDEVFAYYDTERMKSALEFLIKTGHQIMIFTCTNRERELLDEMNVKYKYIML